MKRYLILIEGGTSISNAGPFWSEEDRHKKATSLKAEMDPSKGDNFFKLNVQEDGSIYTHDYIEGELD